MSTSWTDQMDVFTFHFMVTTGSRVTGLKQSLEEMENICVFCGEEALQAEEEEEEDGWGIREEVHEEWEGGKTQATVGAFQIKLTREREWRDGGMKGRVKSMSHAERWGQRTQAEKIYGEFEPL